MCGITGVVNIGNGDPISPRKLQLANDSIRHRGPDDEGIYVESGFGMAMRRLSIIDIQSGHQPIHSPCGRYHICYNGEIYNYLELKNELTSLGHHFLTNSDTEVVLHSYMQWGPSASVNKLRGMFAYCIWDSLSKSLFLARDRMGIKPLYYVENDGRFYFASEIRGLLLHSNVSRQIDLRALDALMTIGFITAPHTILQGVRKLPAAHYLTIRENRISVHNYWELDYKADSALMEDGAIEQFSELLTESVNIHLMSEVPLGALLSGGIDSTTTAALSHRAASSPLKTICIGFTEDYYDEAELAAASAKCIGTNHTPVIFNGTSLDEYPTALYYREEPTAEAVFVAQYYLFKACRQHGLKVVLTGEGADELLGGYPWHRWENWVYPFLRIPNVIRSLFSQAFSSSLVNHQGINRMAGAAKHDPSTIVKRYIDYIGVGDANVKDRLLSSEVKATLDGEQQPSILQSWETFLKPVENQSAGSQLLWLQSRTRLPDWINIGLDRMSMAHSIEARVPFLDHRLWEYCATLPHRFKLGGSYLKPIEKSLLRKALRNQIPEDARLRRKKGLSVPHSAWLAQERLPDWAEWLLSESQIKKRNLFDPLATQKIHKAHRAGVAELDALLMGVLAIQTWCHIFMDGPLDNGAPVVQ